MSASSSPHDPAVPLSSNAPDPKRLEHYLPPMLSAVAGMVDVISFVSLKLFTAHVTGNLVVIAALLARGGPPNLAQILAVPVFILAVAGVWLIAKRLHKSGPALARPLLVVQFLLLVCVLTIAVTSHPSASPRGLLGVVASLVAVSAMACQFALLRLAVPGAPTTAVMTGNLTRTTLSLLDTLSGNPPVVEGARMQLRKTVQLIVGFFIGCLVGAAGFSWLGEWAWSLPVGLAGVALVLPSSRF